MNILFTFYLLRSCIPYVGLIKLLFFFFFLIDYNEYIITADSIQPLVSNVVGKQMGTGASSGDVQYMQQQNHVFVFSTQLANAAGDVISRGECPSLIAYHLAQPATKKYLEVYYMRLNLFFNNTL